jgi:hypothetical protein
MKKIIKPILIVLMLILCISQMAITCVPSTQLWTPKQEKAHQIAQTAREMGLPETDPIITRASAIWNENAYIQYYTDDDAIMLAKTMFGEARGIRSETELACIAWTVLNRVDAGYGSIGQVVTAHKQFAYHSSNPTVNDYGIDLLSLSYDVLTRWNNEKNGQADVGRVLPSDYLWYNANRVGSHNYFYNVYEGKIKWNYSLQSPYTN